MIVGQAARFRVPRELADHVRVHRAEDATCILLCESYEFAFSKGWGARGSRLCNELFAAGWAEGDSPRDRFERGATRLVDGFRAQSPILWPDDPEDPFVGSAAAGFLALLDDGTLHVRWLGDAVALVIRDREVLHASTPHTLREQLRSLGHPDVPAGDIVTRNVMTHDPEVATWDWRAGDHAVVVTNEVPRDQIAAVLDDDLAASAERLVALAGDVFGVAAIVIRR